MYCIMKEYFGYAFPGKTTATKSFETREEVGSKAVGTCPEIHPFGDDSRPLAKLQLDIPPGHICIVKSVNLISGCFKSLRLTCPYFWQPKQKRDEESKRFPK